ncbi:MAG: phosphate ABC transporter ATP-binding protein [Nitrososphaerota archaeon]
MTGVTGELKLTPLYTLQGLCKNFGQIQALRNLSLEIESGETIGLLGYSGAGKTTLLRILAGLETPTAGKMLYRGRPINHKTSQELRKRVTMIFQSPAHIRGDVYTNVAYGLKIRGMSETQTKERVRDILHRVGLEGYQSKSAQTLSGGEQQRLALARALVLDPEVLLLDEPTSNLDPANASMVTEIIKEESAKRTTIVATHNFNQVRRLTKRSIYIENGQVIEDRPTDELFKHPLDERARRFINGEL